MRALGIVFLLFSGVGVAGEPYFDAFALVGPSGASGLGIRATQSSPPSLGHLGFGASAAFAFTPVIVAGVVSDFQLYAQYSPPTSTYGNLRGTRWNAVAPFVLFRTRHYQFKFVLEVIGPYVLLNSGVTGEIFSFNGPRGYRAEIQRKFWGDYYAGLAFEEVSFSEMKDSVSGTRTLTDPFSLWGLGLVVGKIF